MTADGNETLPKPDELLALHGICGELFETLQRWFAVPDVVELDLSDVDAAVAQMGDPVMIAALAMRKLQALRLLATPGVRTSTDVVVAIVNDLDRALLQAPVMRLQLEAETADWDQALAEITRSPHDTEHPTSGQTTPKEVDENDPEADRFQQLHQALHRAVVAIVEASDGEIRYFE